MNDIRLRSFQFMRPPLPISTDYNKQTTDNQFS